MTPLPERADKAQTAAWMGYPPGLKGIVAMDLSHDDWHRAVCAWLGVPSHSMMVAEGDSEANQRLAGHEEDLVLHLQKFVQHARVFLNVDIEVPHVPDARNELHG